MRRPGLRNTLRRRGVEAAHYDLRWVKPLDTELLDEVGRTFRRVITVEDGCLRGGVGEAVAAYFNAPRLRCARHVSGHRRRLGRTRHARNSFTRSADTTSRFSALSRSPFKKRVLGGVGVRRLYSASSRSPFASALPVICYMVNVQSSPRLREGSNRKPSHSKAEASQGR